jgi:lysophospholipase L1-like esterase
MIFKRTILTVQASFNAARKFVIPAAHRVFISLLLTPFLFANCARPGAIAGNGASPIVYAALGDSTGIGLGTRDGGGYVHNLFARIERKRPRSTLINLSAAGATTDDVIDKQIIQLSGTRATLVTVCVGVNDLLRGHEVI